MLGTSHAAVLCHAAGKSETRHMPAAQPFLPPTYLVKPWLPCRLGRGVSEGDLQGTSHSAALCRACVALAAAISNAGSSFPPPDPKLVQVIHNALLRSLQAHPTGSCTCQNRFAQSFSWQYLWGMRASQKLITPNSRQAIFSCLVALFRCLL